MATYAVPTEESKPIRHIKDIVTILVSPSTLTLSQSDKYKPGMLCSVWDIQDILRADLLDHKIAAKDPPEYCTKLIILSLLGLCLPGDWKVFGIVGFITLFFVLASLDAKNAKRGKYSLVLTLNQGYQVQIDFKKENFLKEAIAIIYALKNSHYKLVDHLTQNNYVVLNLKKSEIINPSTEEAIKIKDIVDLPKLRYSTLLPDALLKEA